MQIQEHTEQKKYKAKVDIVKMAEITFVDNLKQNLTTQVYEQLSSKEYDGCLFVINDISEVR